jgi:hypothetical protein
MERFRISPEQNFSNRKSYYKAYIIVRITRGTTVWPAPKKHEITAGMFTER